MPNLNAIQEDQTVDHALARGVLFGSLALGLQPPTEEALKRLLGAEGRDVILEAARLLDSSRAKEDAIAPSAARLADHQDLALADLSARHQDLFGHTARGPVSPFETEYGIEGLFRQPQELADIAGYIRAFGLRPRIDMSERVDHVVCECEFMDFLSRKEAYAMAKEDPEMVENTRKAYRSFLRDHLGRFGRSFAARLVQADGDGFLGSLGSLFGATLGSEAARVNIPAGREFLELRSTEPDGVPMACGTPGDGPATEGGADCGDCPS